MILGLALAWTAILVGCWLGWQLLRQNGRILVRLDELEKRLDASEFGEGQEPESLPVGSEAPAFDLPDLAGERRTLAEFRNQPLLLVFFNPACGFCRDLAPKLIALYVVRRQAERDAALGAALAVPDPNQSAVAAGALQNDSVLMPDGAPRRMLILSTGAVEANRTLFAEHKLDCPVLLQKASEVADAYKAMGTPSGYLVNAEGKIASRLAMGGDALLKLLDGNPESATQEMDKDLLSPALSSNGGEGEEARGNRFSSRSLARSKIKRDGLKAGTPAPDFRLPRLDGRGELALSELRGRRVLLAFSSPHCGPCNELAPELEKFHRSSISTNQAQSTTKGLLSPALSSGGGEREPSLGIQVVMISKGEPKENRAKVKEFGLTFPILLQQRWEISRRYAMFATPIAYLIDEAGVITQDVAVGVDPILAILHEASRHVQAEVPAIAR